MSDRNMALEEAAKVAEEFSNQHAIESAIYFQGIEDAAKHIAAAIRALKDKP